MNNVSFSDNTLPALRISMSSGDSLS